VLFDQLLDLGMSRAFFCLHALLLADRQIARNLGRLGRLGRLSGRRGLGTRLRRLRLSRRRRLGLSLLVPRLLVLGLLVLWLRVLCLLMMRPAGARRRTLAALLLPLGLVDLGLVHEPELEQLIPQ
jgi:hypothetical protein